MQRRPRDLELTEWSVGSGRRTLRRKVTCERRSVLRTAHDDYLVFATGIGKLFRQSEPARQCGSGNLAFRCRGTEPNDWARDVHRDHVIALRSYGNSGYRLSQFNAVYV